MLPKKESEDYLREDIVFHRVYAHMTGDVKAAILLERIMYWHGDDISGKAPHNVFRNGHYWIVKKRYEWWDEIRLSPDEVDRALSILKKLGLIETKIYRFQDDVATHIRVIMSKFLILWREKLNNPPPNPYKPEDSHDALA